MERAISDAEVSVLSASRNKLKVLGYSESEKDTYWTVYQIEESFYIGLNDDEPSVITWMWIPSNLVENYLEIPEKKVLFASDVT